MGVHNIESVEEFNTALKEHKVVFVDFFATWCGPCKAIAPKIVDWSNKYPSVHFLKVDVEAVPDLTQEYGIRAMPTFLVFKDGEKVGDVMGAIPGNVLKLITDNNPESAAESAPEKVAEEKA